MKKSKFLPVIIALAAVLLLLVGAAFWLWGDLLNKDGHAAQKGEDFVCYSYDRDGRRLDGYYDEQEKMWHLFLTSTQTVADTPLYISGSVTTASKGELDAANGVIYGAFSQSGDAVILTAADGTQHTVTALQSDLPCVYLDIAHGTLAAVHESKDQKFEDNSLYITDPAGQWDLTAEHSVQLKGRGNSTWTLAEKKGYQIKLSESMPVLGMGASKKWILLANAFDDSMMRSQLVYTMAQKMDMPFTPSFQYVDLWIDGEYLGTYMMGEKVEIGASRLDLQEPTGALFEHDEGFYMEEDYWFSSKVFHRHFTLKEIKLENEDAISYAMENFEAAVDNFAAYLYTTPPEEITLESLSTMIDVDSFAKYYLINEYVLNRESFVSSFYWYMDGPDDVLHLGPVWDFDSSMGNDGYDYTHYVGHEHLLFTYLLASPEFYARTVELYQQYKPEFAALTENAQTIREQIGTSAEMNYLRWDLLGKPSNKTPEVNFRDTFDEAVDGVQAWLDGRLETFTVAEKLSITAQVSPDCRTMTLRLDDGGKYPDLKFAVRAAEETQQMTLWYAAERIDGVWYSTVDMTHFNTAGFYNIHAYVKNEDEVVASGAGYAEYAVESPYAVSVQMSEDGAMLLLTLQDNTRTLTSVRFEAWGTQFQETTFRQLEGVAAGEYLWSAQIPVCAFNLTEPDDLIVRAYGVDGTSEEIRGARQIALTAPAAHTYDGDTCTLCGHIYGTVSTVARIPIYRICNPNTGERIYTSSDAERDNLLYHGWLDEGIGWYAPIFGGEPVYRLMDPVTFDRYYTMDPDQVAQREQAGWVCESVSFNSLTEGVAVYRLHNPNVQLGSYLYTASEAERDDLVARGWICEGIGWYGVPNV